ncbi:hypothetical protein CR513_31580, partial [Mucuna pruriens]
MIRGRLKRLQEEVLQKIEILRTLEASRQSPILYFVIFLSCVVGSKGVKVDVKKVKAYRVSQHPSQLGMRFVKGFSILAAPFNEIVKKYRF